MKFSTNTKINISKSELMAVANYQDNIREMIEDIAKVFGQNVQKVKFSARKKLKLALGGTETITTGPIKVNISKKGIEISINIDEEIPAEVTVEYFEAVTDIVSYYLPVVTSTVTGIMAANSMAETRANKAAKKIAKALKR
jgi:hypothetical protein